MRLIRNFITIFALLLVFACIKPYNPVIESNAANKLVVSGRVTDVEGWQEVNVSTTSPIGKPQYLPVSGCTVSIRDDKGNVFPMAEDTAGYYRAWIGKEYLNAGTAYKVSVITPENETVESSYDTLMPAVPLDSVYYVIEDVPTSNPDIYIRGMQFYVDLKAEGYQSRNFKWEIFETFEFHAKHAVEYYYDGTSHQVLPPDSSHRVCWSTGMVRNVYTLTTKNLTANAFQKFPLHFVDGSTPRLSVLYSFLVKQLALSESAYNYWEMVRVNSSELGGLYEKQPLAIKGNLVNLTDPGKEVLGYFSAASESSRRYFYKDVPGIELNFMDFCNEDILGQLGWKIYSKNDYPVYYYFNLEHSLRLLNVECVDCRAMGGSTVKPDFWPQ
jgi:hypothetical protein